MGELDSKLYSLLGDKTLSFGCFLNVEYDDTIWNCHGGDPIETTIRRNTVAKYIDKFQIYIKDEFFWEEILPIRNIENPETNVIGHEPTIADLHRWMNERFRLGWTYSSNVITRPYETEGFHIRIKDGLQMDNSHRTFITYDSYESLLSQSDETKKSIIAMIECYEKLNSYERNYKVAKALEAIDELSN